MAMNKRNQDMGREDFNDSLDNLFDRTNVPKGAGEMPSIMSDDIANSAVRKVTGAAYNEPCKACRGTGNFTSYTGRYVGKCYKCKGKGKKEFKTDAATREKSKEYATARKARHIDDNVDSFMVAYPDQYAWMMLYHNSFEFARAMFEAVKKYGSLTERQLAAIDGIIARKRIVDEERKNAVKSAPDAEGYEKILDAFKTAKANRKLNVATDNDVGTIDKLPTLRLSFDETHNFICSPARKDESIIYVKDTNHTYLGKIVNGKFLRSRECTPEVEARLLSVARDPSNAAKAFGLRFAICSCCGRQLTNETSRTNGIGPICASKWGL